MALLDSLQSAHSANGFDLTTTITTLAGAVGAVDPDAVALDPSALARIGGGLGGGDLSAIGGAVSAVAAQAGQAGTGLPLPDGLLAPLTSAIGTVQRLTQPATRGAIGSLESAAASAGGAVGLAGLAPQLSALEAAAAAPPVADALSLVSGLLPGGVRLDAQVARLAGDAPALAALVRLLGALAATDSLSSGAGSTASLVRELVDPAQLAAALRRLKSLAEATGLPQAVDSIDPNDPDAVDLALGPILVFADGIRTAADTLVRGMAFGEATLVHADLAGVESALQQAATALDESALAGIRQLALDVRAWLDPLLSLDLGTPADSLDAFWGEVTARVADLAALVDAIDPATVARPVTSGLADALSALHAVEQAAHSVEAAVRSASQTIKQAVESVDMRPVTEAVHAVFQPVVTALGELQQLVGDAQADIGRLAGDVVDGMNAVKGALGDAATAIHAAFDGVAQIVDDLHLDQLQQELQTDVQTVAGAIGKAQLKPYFDTAVDAMNTVATVVRAVPLSLLPDDARQELDAAVQPIKEIDFDTAIKGVLEGELDDIVHTLDTDVLSEVEAAYQQVLAFLQEIDPRGPLERFEHDEFDPMLARVQALDPAEVLAPVQAVLDELKAAVAQLDFRRDVLAPLDDAFGELEQAFARLDPSQLVGPIVDEFDALRTQIVDALKLDTWSDRLGSVDTWIAGALARLDFEALVALLDSAWDELRGRAAAGGDALGTALGTLVTGLLEGSGLTIASGSLTPVLRWISGAESAADAVSARLGAAADALDEARAAVEAVDPQALVAQLQPIYTAVVAAVQVYPEESLLRRQLDPVLAASAPVDLLGTTVDNRSRFADELRQGVDVLRRLQRSGRSELTAVSRGLRDAVRPLTAVPQLLDALLGRVGIQVEGRGLGSALADALAELEPSRSLAPLTASVAALKAKVASLVHDGVVAPLQSAVSDLKSLVDDLDISFLRDDLQAIHDAIAADIDALKPSNLLGDVLSAVEVTQQTIAAFDPLAPVRDVVDAMKAAVTEVANEFRPTALFASILTAYEHILDAASGLDVQNLLKPILDAIDEVNRQLHEGLDETADALDHLQAALP